MDIEAFMRGYQAAWESSDEQRLVALFTPDAEYHNTPFAVQRGHGEIKRYWERTKLQRDIHLTYEIVHAHVDGGVAHWRTRYQVTSEEMFRMWAASAGTGLPSREPGDPLPRLVLDGIAIVEIAPEGLCRRLRLWWHSIAET